MSVLSVSTFNPDLFPSASSWTSGSVTPAYLIPKNTNDAVSSFLEQIIETKKDMELYTKTLSNTLGSVATKYQGYEEYFQYPNAQIAKLASKIVKEAGATTDTEKMYAVEQWVNNNISYELDDTNYRTSEYWAKPTETLAKGDGDCEDMAFLISSLALHAGVNPSRVRMYGGYVKTGAGAMSNYTVAGHGWSAFKRDDGEWVPIEGSYYPTDTPIDERTPLKDNRNYVEDFWYVTKDGTVDATFRNFIRDPEMGVRYSKGFLKGININITA